VFTQRPAIGSVLFSALLSVSWPQAVSAQAEPGGAKAPAVVEESKGLSAIEAKKLLDRERSAGREAAIIDVRAVAEFERGHIPGALCISARDEKGVAQRIEERVGKSQGVLIYSGSGTRSGRVAKALRSLGFTQVWSLDQGLRAWEREGFRIQAGG
jgi:rhodanese-related sulfurtransferase